MKMLIHNEAPSKYARVFNIDDFPSYEIAMVYLKAMQSYANERLLFTKGYVCLNEVYDLLDLPHSEAGECVGWIFGIDHIEFGLNNITHCASGGILLDFNVSGVIV